MNRDNPEGSATSKGDSMLSVIGSISVVIPAFNEEKRVAPTLASIHDYLVKNAERSEIIVVDDGSSDKTAELVSAVAAEKGSIRLLHGSTNRGKGDSVRRGILEASGDLILMSDADLSTPIEEVEKFFPWIEQGYDIVIGSRALKESDLIQKQPWYRQSMGRVFNLLVRTIVLEGLYDTQCGFKMFRSGPAKKIFAALKTEGFAFDVEVLLRARKIGCRIKETPVRWINSPQSKIRIMRDSFRMFLDLLKIRMSV
jgi:dolichyl-phosphate beta-glucosyltransferase